MLTEVADGVLLRRSDFCMSNAVVVRGTTSVLVVDPGVSGADLDELADDVEGLGLPVAAGLATHPHWDHLLWHPRLGDGPRYATATAVAAAVRHLPEIRAETALFAPGVPLDTVGSVVPLAEGDAAALWDGRIRLLEHQAHAPGHLAVLLADTGALLAGDMLSDVEIPLLDTEAVDQCASYLAALDLLQRLTKGHVDVVIPGHGTVARGGEIAARIAADRRYIEAITHGFEPDDPRVGPGASYGADWLPAEHQRNVDYARRGTSGRR